MTTLFISHPSAIQAERKEKKMKVTLKYDRGTKTNEVVALEVPAHEFEEMIEFDYQERLAKADEGEVTRRRTAQEILDEMNRREYNSWQSHNRRSASYQNKANEADDMDTMDLLPDASQMEEMQKNDNYEIQCQKIRELLKPDQAKMIIAICLDGMRVKDYADMIQGNRKRVSERLNYAKGLLKDALSKN